MKQILHVGMGKCASTFLQQKFFPAVAKSHGSISYFSSSEVVRAIRTSQRLGLSAVNNKSELFQAGIHSCEDLIGWNPSHWATAVEDMAEVVSRESRVVLILRDPLDYLLSFYVQQLKTGHVVDFREWWTAGDIGQLLVTSNPRFGMRHINIDHLDYELLVKLLAKKFDDLVVLPLSSVHNMKLLHRAFEVPWNASEAGLVSGGNGINERLSHFQVETIKRLNGLLKTIGLQFHDKTTAHQLFSFGSKSKQNRFSILNFAIKATSIIPSPKFALEVSDMRQNATLKRSAEYLNYLEKSCGGFLDKF